MFTLTIDTSNDAFQPDPGPEVGRLLRQVVHEVEAGYDARPLRDENGNTVGSWSLTGADVGVILAEMVAALDGVEMMADDSAAYERAERALVQARIVATSRS